MNTKQQNTNSVETALQRFNRTHRIQAFSLIELVVVLLLAAVLASIAGVTVRQTQHQHTLQEAVAQLEAFDFQTRQLAVQFNQPTVAVFDLNQGRIERHRIQDDAPRGQPIQFDHRIRITEIRLPKQAATFGTLNVPFSTVGVTPTYAIRLEMSSPYGDNTLGDPADSIWLLFCGLTGRITEFSDRQPIESIFDALGGDA